MFSFNSLIWSNIYYLKREKKLKKTEIKQHQEDNKVRMQEELIRKSLQKEVSVQEAHEKARRIMESKSEIADGDEAKTKAIDMLIDVQKQLLDVFTISKVSVVSVASRLNIYRTWRLKQAIGLRNTDKIIIIIIITIIIIIIIIMIIK